MNKTQNNGIIGAGLLMEELFDSNIYQSYTMAKNNVQAIKDEMKNRISEDIGKVHFENQGVIVRYMNHNTYQYNVQALNEYLWDLGILVHVARFNDIEELKEFRKPIEHYTKFNLGKLGRTAKQEYDFSNLTDEELVQQWLKEKKEEEGLEVEIEKAKSKMINDPTLNSLPEGERKLPCSYGSISLLNKKRTHYNGNIFEKFGKNYVIENSTPSMEELDKFITDGYLTNKELEQFRTLVKVTPKFIMMTQESYQKQWDVLQDKRNRQSRNLQELWSHKVEV